MYGKSDKTFMEVVVVARLVLVLVLVEVVVAVVVVVVVAVIDARQKLSTDVTCAEEDVTTPTVSTRA